MWPWDHLAVGYLALSLIWRARGKAPPRSAAAYAAAFGALFPDLIDKPLGWGTTLLPSGVSLAHSLLFAVPVVTVTAFATHRLGRKDIGVAFAVGYLSHLPGDVVYPLVVGSDPKVAFLLWPLLPVPATEPVSIAANVSVLFDQFLIALGTPAGRLYLLAEATMLGAAAAAWVLDGRPGVGRTRPVTGPQ